MCEDSIHRQTITKHVKEFEKSDFAKEQIRKFKLLKPQILTSLYRIGADHGNIKVFKLLLDVIDRSECNKTENNFIQINNIAINIEAMKTLPQPELIKILKIVDGQEKTS